MSIKYGSICSGIEAASVAWIDLGWEPHFFSEIEGFPSSVLNHHYPEVPNHGDMTNFGDWPDESIDLLVGGTPCQSFSVAGLRGGLDDPRGNLALTYLGITQRYAPRWIVWENVPGVLSSRGGRDFGSFLGVLGELGYGFAYRVLDAQFFGVAQRRRRVFVVGYLGDWRRAAAALFERESLSWNNKKVGSRSAYPTLQRTCYDYSRADGFVCVHTERGLRRITPVEAERLQGFPDDYTNIYNKTPDSTRYMAIGNSMAVPVMKWIGQRINKADSIK